MIRNEDHWVSLTDSFFEAAFGRGDWHAALAGLAEATGSRSGELIGLGADAAVPFNVLTNVEPGLEQAFLDAGGGNPSMNPRVHAGVNAPVLKVLAESDFITPDEYKRHPHYQEFAVPWKIPFICLTTLERDNNLLVGLAVLRSQRQGHITDAQRACFTLLAPHVRAAVRTQIMLEGEGDKLLLGAMEALSLPAFVCDKSGRVRAFSPKAEELVDADLGLQMRHGRLYATKPTDDKALKNAIDDAVRGTVMGGAPAFHRVVLHAEPVRATPLVLDVAALPQRPFEFNFMPRVLILARGERGQESRRATLLRTAYALTPAEAEIALHITNGKTPETIAAIRGVSVGTVRIQIKAILAKLGVGRQVELAAKVSQL